MNWRFKTKLGRMILKLEVWWYTKFGKRYKTAEEAIKALRKK
jgi:hypothetical protein